MLEQIFPRFLQISLGITFIVLLFLVLAAVYQKKMGFSYTHQKGPVKVSAKALQKLIEKYLEKHLLFSKASCSIINIQSNQVTLSITGPYVPEKQRFYFEKQIKKKLESYLSNQCGIALLIFFDSNCFQ